LLICSVANAQNLRYWINEEYLTGDWNGKRTNLANRGILFTIQYWNNLAGNPTGGLEQGFTYTDQQNFSVDFDMQKLTGWNGGKLHVVFNNGFGESLSAEDIGNQFPVQQLFGGGERFRLVELSVEQSFANDQINIRGGRYPNDDFATTAMHCLFMSQAFCGYPQGVGQDVNLPY
jgi:porin